MTFPKFVQSVGVAPGTTTMQLGDLPPGYPERSQWYPLSPWAQYQGRIPLGALPPPRIRWDIIGVVGGGSLVLALAIGLVATALSK